MISKSFTILTISLVIFLNSFALALVTKPKVENAAAKIKSVLHDRFFFDKNISAANALPRTNDLMPQNVKFPNDTVLEAELASIVTVNIDLFASGLEYDPMIYKDYHHYITRIDLLDEFKQKNVACSYSEPRSELDKIHGAKSMCTSHMQTIHRTVIYPWQRKISVSKCLYCAGLELIFACDCKPVYILQAALRPGKIGADGFHERLPCLELVPIDYRAAYSGSSV